MTFSFLSRNCFVRSFIARVRPVFIKVGKFVGFLRSNLKKAEVGVVLIDKCYKML